MQYRTLAIVLIVLGIAMFAYTGFDYVTTSRIANLGPLEINRTEHHTMQWSPIVGGVLLAIGVVIIFLHSSKKI
jgi:hypothetical protein